MGDRLVGIAPVAGLSYPGRPAGRVLEAPRPRDTPAAGGYEIITDSPAELRRFIESELGRYAEIARRAGICFD